MHPQEDSEEFDFPAWANAYEPPMPTFRSVVEGTVEQLVVGWGTLKHRLPRALFVFCYNAHGFTDVPDDLRPQLESILQAVGRRVDENTDLKEFQEGITRMRREKARRIAWMIWQLYREVARRPA